MGRLLQLLLNQRPRQKRRRHPLRHRQPERLQQGPILGKSRALKKGGELMRGLTIIFILLLASTQSHNLPDWANSLIAVTIGLIATIVITQKGRK